MADGTTSNLGLTQPEVGASQDTWGGKLNTDLTLIDNIFNSGGTGTSVGLNVGSGKTLNVDGTFDMTGSSSTIGVANGGTGASTATNARTNLGLGTLSTQNSNSVSITGGSATFTTALSLSNTAANIVCNDTDGTVGGSMNTRVMYQANGTLVGWTGFSTAAGAMYVKSDDGSLFLSAPAAKGVYTQVNSVNTVQSTESYTQVYNQLIAGPSGTSNISGVTQLHVATSDSGLASVNSNYANAVIESSSSTGMTIVGGATNTAGIAFASPSSNATTYMFHNNNGNSFRLVNSAGSIEFFTNNGPGVSISSNSAKTLNFNSGYGSVAAAYGCRAWVNFNGTGTVAIRDSGGVSSITDNGTGDYTVNFSFTMPDTNYSVTGVTNEAVADNRSSGWTIAGTGTSSLTTTGVTINVGSQSSGGAQDLSVVTVAVFR